MSWFLIHIYLFLDCRCCSGIRRYLRLWSNRGLCRLLEEGDWLPWRRRCWEWDPGKSDTFFSLNSETTFSRSAKRTSFSLCLSSFCLSIWKLKYFGPKHRHLIFCCLFLWICLLLWLMSYRRLVHHWGGILWDFTGRYLWVISLCGFFSLSNYQANWHSRKRLIVLTIDYDMKHKNLIDIDMQIIEYC